MTREEAQLQATKRWGDLGGIFDREDDAEDILKMYGDLGEEYITMRRNARKDAISRVGRYWVGHKEFDIILHVYGNGNTWEEAFAAADKMQTEVNRRAN